MERAGNNGSPLCQPDESGPPVQTAVTGSLHSFFPLVMSFHRFPYAGPPVRRARLRNLGGGLLVDDLARCAYGPHGPIPLNRWQFRVLRHIATFGDPMVIERLFRLIYPDYREIQIPTMRLDRLWRSIRPVRRILRAAGVEGRLETVKAGERRISRIQWVY